MRSANPLPGLRKMTMLTQADWIARAREVLPGGGFGNFDPGVVIREGEGARLGRGRARICRPADRLRPDAARPRPPGGAGGGVGAAAEGHDLLRQQCAGIELAEAIVDAVPCAEQVRFVSTGGEADMYAMRLARAFTGREKILKFEGGYHGMSAEAQMSLAPYGW
jgi:glutamate-1-semialdehyde 2,1-aminomutase